MPESPLERNNFLSRSVESTPASPHVETTRSGVNSNVNNILQPHIHADALRAKHMQKLKDELKLKELHEIFNAYTPSEEVKNRIIELRKPENRERAKKAVLILEDGALYIKFYKENLSDHEIFIGKNGKEGLQLLNYLFQNNISPVALVSDFNMPEYNGKAVLDFLRVYHQSPITIGGLTRHVRIPQFFLCTSNPENLPDKEATSYAFGVQKMQKGPEMFTPLKGALSKLQR